MLKPSVEVRIRDGVLQAEFWDCLRLDPAPVRELRAAYERHVARGGKSVVVVDLRGVGFAGSAALGGFVAIRKLGARVVLCNVEPTVREVLRVSNLEPLFAFSDDVESAFRDLGGAASGPGVTHGSASPPPEPPRSVGAPPLRRPRRSDPG